MRTVLLVLVALLCVACGGKPVAQSGGQQPEVPLFNADSAYSYVQSQVDFGARVPESAAHAACADFLANTLERFGAQVTVQTGERRIYSGETKTLKNIIGSYHSTASKRVLLCAHWDSRPFADQDANPDNWRTPILGANDGASGVGVLLEVARQLSMRQPECGVDIVFFDLEDCGTPEFDDASAHNDVWCLGSQFWAEQAQKNGYKADFGILLDMVGAPGAQFYREQFSNYFAANQLDAVWQTAQAQGFGTYFVDVRGGAITDDHYYVNTIAHIPCIDIIQCDPYSTTGFASYWHTLDDTMRHIDRNTLFVVGQTLLHVIFD